MSWRTVGGNNQRNSQAGVGTNLSTEVWNYTFATPEQPAGPPVVSPNGYVWIMSKDTVGFDFTLFLYCFNATGTLISKQALQYDQANDNTTARLATLSDDSVVVPWTDRQRNFQTGEVASLLTGLPSIYSLRSNETVVLTTNEDSTWSVNEGSPAGGTVSPTSGTSTTYTAPPGTGVFHVDVVSNGDATHNKSITIYVSTVVTANWERTFPVSDTSYVHTDAPCIGAADALNFSYFDDTNGYTHIAMYDAAGNLLRDFTIDDAGVFYNCNIVPLTMDAIGFYVAGRQIPASGTAKTTLLKFDGLGRLLWKTYFGNFSDTVTLSAPSVSANVVAIYARESAILGWITIHALNPATGTLLWSFEGNTNDYANGTHLPAIDNTDMVYGGHFGSTGETANLRQVDFALGTQNWLYTDAADPQDYPTSPVLGNDGHLLWYNGNINRVKVSDGSEVSKNTSLVAQFTPPDFSHFAFQPALVNNYLYVTAPGAASGSLHAYSISGGGGTPTPFPNPPQRYPAETFLQPNVPTPLIPGFPPLPPVAQQPVQVAAETFLTVGSTTTVTVIREANIDIAKPTAVFWYHENRLYASFAGHTYCRDMLSQDSGWVDCGYGYVNSRFIISRFAFPSIAFLVSNMTPIAYGDRSTVVSLTHRNMTADNKDTTVVPFKQVHFRPFDGGRGARDIRKLAERIRVWGSLVRKGNITKVGKVTWRGERGVEQSANIYDGIYEPDELLDQRLPNSFMAWLLECDLDFDENVTDLEILQSQLEFLPLDR